MQKTTDPTWWRKNLEMALADDPNQDIDDFNVARNHLYTMLLEDASTQADFDLNLARATIAKLYSRSRVDHRAALDRLMAVRKCFLGGGVNCARL